MEKRIAIWSTARDAWMVAPADISEPSELYLATWPASGMTRNGTASELPTSAPLTKGSASSLLLKTPTAQLAVNGGSQHPDKWRAGGHGPTLADEIEFLLPTPQAHDAQAPKTPEQVATMRAKGHGVANLNEVAANVLLPTPTSRDWKSEASSPETQERNARPLGETIRTLLASTGDDSNPPSGDGNPSSDDPPLTPPSPDPEVDNDSRPTSSNG